MTVLTPMYGLGSGARTIGAISVSCPRTRIGSAARIYNFTKKTQGQYVAMYQIQKSIFGPFVIQNGRLVWN